MICVPFPAGNHGSDFAAISPTRTNNEYRTLSRTEYESERMLRRRGDVTNKPMERKYRIIIQV
jgi:hypothetical protein